jgi:hypothetical protein
VRVLGSRSERLARSLVEWNAACGIDLEPGAPPLLLVADDVLGGMFAVNGGRFGGAAGEVYYFAPDTLSWETLGRGYTDFIYFLLQGDLTKFYADRRWPGWQGEVAELPGDRAVFLYPPLWAAGPPVAERQRGTVPLKEAIEVWRDVGAPW